MAVFFLDGSRQEGEGNHTADPNVEEPLFTPILDSVTETASCGTLAMRGDATQKPSPAAEAKIVNALHLISDSCWHGTAMHC